MEALRVLIGALFGTAFVSGFISAVACAIIFGRRTGDSSGNWSIYPLIVAFFWFISLVGSLSISIPLFRLKFDLYTAATYGAIIAGLVSIIAAIVTQANNPDLHGYYTK